MNEAYILTDDVAVLILYSDFLIRSIRLCLENTIKTSF